MKISVLGNIIDTNNIYKITPIVGDHCWSKNKEQSIKNFRIFDYILSFTIEFFNDKKIYIQSDFKKLNLSEMYWDGAYELYLKGIQMQENQLTLLRDKIIDFWNKDKSEIPRLEL